MNTDIVIVDAVRTAIGEFGGALREHPPADLGSAVVRALLARTGVSGDTMDQVIFGNVHQTSTGDMYLARRVALGGGGQGMAVILERV
ncbi:hypothetical protein [Pandoraea sputorum]|uniref:thiolase family protein n=1 Tax=Pandoraea sputorum TaxID=93222 RepID=UPI002AF6C6A1|nr:hypothetical protein [Pandoraea sputorum]BET12611.1 hypothetical protein THI4931_36530 [Pandoraea sputorum]